jgi:hypothetical protein
MAPTSDCNRAHEGICREALTIPKGLIDSYRQDLCDGLDCGDGTSETTACVDSILENGLLRAEKEDVPWSCAILLAVVAAMLGVVLVGGDDVNPCISNINITSRFWSNYRNTNPTRMGIVDCS